MNRLRAKQPTDTTLLRQALAALENTPVLKHADAIEALLPRFRHEIDVIDVALDYTCSQFALGISGDPILRDLQSKWHVALQHDFWSWMIERKLKLFDKSADGQLILYFAGPRWTHVGRVVGAQVVSKWGTFPIYRHPVEQVPSIYGNRVVFAAMPTRHEAFDWLLEYARNQNVPEDRLSTYRELRYSNRTSAATPE